MAAEKRPYGRPQKKNGDGSLPDTPQASTPALNRSSESIPPPSDDAIEECNVQIPSTPKDSSFWITLFFFVGPIYMITPLSWIYFTWHVARFYLPQFSGMFFSGSPPIWKRVLFGYCTFECIFSLYYQWLSFIARRTPSKIPRRESAELQEVFNKVIQSGLVPSTDPNRLKQELKEPLPYSDPRAEDFRNNFRRWFRGAPWRNITRRSASEWLAWSMFDRKLDDLPKSQQEAVEEATQLLERRAGSTLPDEPENGQLHIVPIMLTWDRVVVWSRPAVVYIGGEFATRRVLWRLKRKYGLVLRNIDGFGYLIRGEGATGPPEHSPIVIMHGLGFGLPQYGSMIEMLLDRLPQSQPVLIPLQPHLSHAILHPYHMIPPSPQTVVEKLTTLFKRLHWDEKGVTVISHSKGTVTHTWMLKARPELIKRSCFMDPVCFCLWEGDLAWNFVYRAPSTGMELVLKYFAATEPGIAVAIQRHFDWGANSMWFEDIPNGRDPYYTRFVLGGKDAVIAGNRVRRYLMYHGVDEGLRWHPNGRHAQPIFDERYLRDLTEWVLAPEPQSSPPPPPGKDIKVDKGTQVNSFN